MEKPKVTVYSDGGAEPNPGPGGWGVVLLFEKDGEIHEMELKGGEVETTNNRMELIAATEALKTLKQPCEIAFFTDSQYLQKGITEWMVSWKRNNFKKGKIQNADLWRSLDVEAAKHDIHWQWVKAHANNKYNERADALAAAGRAEALGLSGSDAILAAPHRIYLSVSGAYGAASGHWAVLLEKEDKQTILTGQEAQAGPQRLVLLAAATALEAIPEKEISHVFTTSDYLRDGVKGWIKAWKRNGWRTKDGAEVKHRDLWEKLDLLAQSRTIKLSSIEDDDPHMVLLHDKLKEVRANLLDD